ncbi:hypothetical protein NliqN6_5589 [Naganishia liquefaciens]|uniref:Major facilitator superfamily (MFS) profile domain-containing protein n=1 Tax=Naganishia liquefaciens TaxID=104408 RepID=A0A8H3YIH0_9TREE|nr:hypothetical protein NliqN6_5589 [Naganishia liquefaciens]
MWSLKRKQQARDGASADESIDPQTGAVVSNHKSKEERAFVRRLDMFLMTFGCLSQIIKYLDQTNISSAYVSGMKEDLNMYGNEYNYFTTYFSVGYCIFLIPSQIAITYFRPNLWLPCLEIGWGILTGLIAMSTNVKQVYALRAFLGVFESSAYPGTVTLLMSWYTPHELALRIGFYHSCQSIGSMLSNALQTAIKSTMDNHLGMAGWRWLFVINAIMTVALGLAGFVMIPNWPDKPNRWAIWLKPHHYEIAVARTARFKRASNKKFTWATVKRSVKLPLFYLIPCLYVATVLAQAGYQYFNLWLKALKHADGTPVWSTNDVLIIPIGGNALAVACVWIYAFFSDYFHTRWLIVMVQAFIGLIPAIILSVWNVSDGAKYFSFFISFTVLATAPPIFSWLSDLCPHDAEQRAFILGWAIALYYAISSWSQVYIWPAKEAPHYKAGWKVSIGLWILVIILLCTLRILELKVLRPRNLRITEEKDAEAIAGAAERGDAPERLYATNSEDALDIKDDFDQKESLDRKDKTVVKVLSAS